MVEFNKKSGKKLTPISRNSMLFSDEDFNLEIEFGREYMEHDANQTVVLYEVDLQKTKVDDLYKEADNEKIRFKPPVEIPVIYEISDAELKTYSKEQMKGYYQKTGKLTFGVYIDTLKEYDCDIKRGDYIGIPITPEHMEFFTVADDGRNNFANKNTLYGTTPYYRTIICAPVDENEFRG